MNDPDRYNTYGRDGVNYAALQRVIGLTNPAQRATVVKAVSELAAQFTAHDLQMILTVLVVGISSEREEHPLELISLLTMLVADFAPAPTLKATIAEMEAQTISTAELERMFTSGDVQ